MAWERSPLTRFQRVFFVFFWFCGFGIRVLTAAQKLTQKALNIPKGAPEALEAEAPIYP